MTRLQIAFPLPNCTEVAKMLTATVGTPHPDIHTEGGNGVHEREYIGPEDCTVRPRRGKRYLPRDGESMASVAALKYTDMHSGDLE